MKSRHYLFFFILLFFILKESKAQKTPLDFNLVRGSKNVTLGKITSITQDSWGYMWFVDQGNSQLVRYDGYRMKVFKNNPVDTNSINKSHFECIAADSVGNVWFPADGGVDKLNSSTGNATHYKLKSGIASILVDHLGFVWLGTGIGLCRLDPRTGKADYYGHDENDSTSISSNIIRVIYEDREGVIWTGNGLPFVPDKDGGLNKFNRVTGKFIRYMHDPNNPHSLINDKVRAILEDSRGNFWVGSQGDGLHIMNRKTGTFERLTYDPAHPEKLSRPPVPKDHLSDHITFIKEDICGNIWIGTYSQGIERYDPVTKKITHFIGDKINPNGFRDSTTWCEFTSRDGTFWIATETSNLLYRVNPFQKFITIIHTGDPANSFAEDKVGNLWVGTEGSGVFKFDEQNKEVAHFTHNSLDPLSPPDNHNMISAMANDDKIWSGTYRGLRIIDEHTNKFYKVITNSNLFKDSSQIGFVSALKDKNGISWFSTWGHGLLRYNSNDSSVKQFLPHPKDSSSISSTELNHLLEDRQGRLWIIGSGGIHKMNRKTEKFKNYLPETFIGSIYQDSKNNIWAGTEKNLYRYDEEKDTFAPFFDPSSMLYSTTLGGIIEDNNHNLWLNSHSSIIKLNPLTKQFFIYGDKYGIGNNSMAPWAKPFKNKKGQLLYGGGDGFGIFYPQELEVKTDFKISISDFFINTIPVLPGKESVIQKPVEDITELDLKYNQNNIAFNFSTLDYRDPESIQYLTRIEGYDNTWREVIGEKSSNYFNLQEGKYTYHIKAINKDGTEAEKTITITINPPWWQTWWAYTLYALIIIIAVWSFIRWRTKLLEKEKLVLERKVTERTQELKKEKEIVETTLHELKATQGQLIQSEKMASLGELTAGIAHEIQNPLNFVNNFSEVNTELIEELKAELANGNQQLAIKIADDIKDNEQKINHHGKRADAIVKGMLQHSKSSSGIKESTDINALADEYLRLSYHGLRAKEKSFNAKFETDLDPALEKINIVPQDIGRVLLNLINNAFYAVDEKQKQNIPGFQPTVTVATKKLGNKAQISVQDNGNGIPQKVIDKIFQPFFTTKPTGQGTGLGLSLSYDIIKAHGGEIKVETKEKIGTEFIISLPL